MGLQINQSAPAFKLYNTEKKEISLESLRGKNVLLLFFPFAFTGTCTAELCSVRDNIALYNGLDATVLGISVDSPFTLAKYKEDQRLNFDLLSDFNKEVSAAYGSIYAEFGLGLKGVSKRSAFVIDRQGIIRYAEVLENASLIPDFDKIRKTLEELG